MNTKIPGSLVIGLLAVPMGAGAAEIATPIEGSVTAVVVTTLHSTETVDAHSDGFSGAPISLSQTAHAISGSLSSEYVEGHTGINANWTSPDSGTVEFSFDGSIQAVCCGNAVYHTSSRGGGDDWSYTFLATTDGVFRLEYTATGNHGAAGGLRILIDGEYIEGFGFAFPHDGTTLTGSDDFPLVAGHTYTFALENFAGFSTTGTGNYASSALVAFEILPPDIGELLDDLIEEVIGLNVQAGIGNALDSKLQNALAAMDRAKAGDTGAAIAILHAFINSVEAQRGKSLTDAQADALIAAAQAIIDSLT